jgi:hypothetical protein
VDRHAAGLLRTKVAIRWVGRDQRRLPTRRSKRLRDVPVGRIVTTDSVAPQSGLPLPIEVVPIAPMLAEVITRLDQHRSLGALISDQ